MPDRVGTIKVLKNTNCPKFNFCVQSQKRNCVRNSFLMGTYYVVLDLLGSYFCMFIIYHNPVISHGNHIMKIGGKICKVAQNWKLNLWSRATSSQDLIPFTIKFHLTFFGLFSLSYL